MAERRFVWLNANGPCVKCGSDEDLEVDHIDPSLKIDHKVWSWSDVRRSAELAKCQVLCHKCHARKTAASRPQKQHGTHSMYTSGCRCQPCRDGHAALKRDYLKRKQSIVH